ncbi:hypothetical protein CMUS01_11647 [Colletotrichum musicola]|uniref:Uncharacterized protein n=1 Tax=Colletotrichum musicola TaxID=2175873 RepID=A0A8H6JW12_9PEZI|nr:hypothetical protein CMUS01_11647 [Colletotrichum musicola]
MDVLAFPIREWTAAVSRGPTSIVCLVAVISGTLPPKGFETLCFSLGYRVRTVDNPSWRCLICGEVHLRDSFNEPAVD